jgi:hypothetical protein
MTKSSRISSSKNPMELVDRYLQAVRFWLPRTQQEDIIAELSEDLHAQIEEQEAALGHQLSAPELEAILKRRGRPVLVANRYLPQESLIGPVLFPIYKFVLKIVALCYLVPWVLVWFGMMSFSASYRAEHTGAGWLGAIVSAWSSLWFIAFMAVGTVTIVFAALERAQAKSGFLDNWDAGKLPPVRNPNQIPRSGSIVEVVANLVFGIWWIDIMSSPVILDRPEIRIVMSPVWRYFFWGFLLLALINTAVAGVNLARPYWTVLRASVRLATNGAASGLFCWMMKASLLAEITGAHISASRALEITNAINLGMGKVFPVVLAIGVVIALVDVWRILRARNAVPVQLKGAVSAAVV